MLSTSLKDQDLGTNICQENTDIKSIAFSQVIELPLVSEELDVVLERKASAPVEKAFRAGQEGAQIKILDDINVDLQANGALPHPRAQFTETWAHRGASKGYRRSRCLH